MPEQETQGLPFDLKGITGVKSGAETEFKEVKFKEAETEDEENEDNDGEDSAEANNEEASAEEEVSAESEAAESEATESEEAEGETEESEEEAESETEEEPESSEEEIKTEDEQSLVNIYELSDGVFETEAEFKSTAKLLKENPELKGMLDFYEKNGTLLPYLQATMINPDAISDDELFWQEYKAENAGTDLDESDLRILFEEDVLSQYESEDESRIKINAVKKKRAANELRERVKEDLKSLLLPQERDVHSEASAQVEAENSAKKEAQKNKLSFQIRKEIKDGKIDVKVDDKISVKLDVSPRKISQLLESISDPAFLQTKEGSFDLKRMAILADPDAFIKSVVTSSKSEGKKEFVTTELKARPPKGKAPEGDGSPSKPVKRFDPRDKSTWGGITSVKPAY